MIQLINAPSELGAGTRGASLGYKAIKTASLHVDPTFFKRYEPIDVETANNLLFEHVDNPYGKRIKGVVKMYRRIAAQVAETMDDQDFPLVISGDHSNAGGTIAGVAQANPGKRLGVVWIDAHSDLHSPYTSPSGNVHGMPLATAIAEDNKESAINDVRGTALRSWDQMKGSRQRVKPEDIVFIALRSSEEPEVHLINKYNMAVHRTEDVREKGVKAIYEASLERLKDCDIIYVTFDVDSMDPEVSIGTGTPVPGGLTEAEATEFLQLYAANEKVACMEFTEVNPLLDDKGNAMGEAAFRCLKATVEALEKRK
ncbi:arginase [Phaeocystidibacter luteus]|uniref:Arginase n=1 Tax=Phaeocystidibacter luteus TaxID=911197 RepID=A0A6N6RK38_9FLAO|nr:arginase [Phaeocystidibacter luteus]KAB2814281.1 arginase [Phaeocystidibacter luteus]